MTERRHRNVPVHTYAPDQGSDDDSKNNGNVSIDESEFETVLSIGTESPIDYHGDDNDDHEGTGVDNAIELLLPADVIEEGTALDNAIELLSPPDVNEEGTGVDNVIELLSPPDENEGEDEIVGEDTKTQVRQSLVLLLLLFFCL